MPSLVEQIKDKYLGKVVTDARSPAGNWMGLTLERMSKGDVMVSMIIRKEMTNPYGNIHGGMMSLLIDETIGWAVVSLENENHYTSLNLNVDFLYAIKEGERLYANAKIIRSGKKIVHAVCEVNNAEGTLLAKAASNLVVTSMKIQ
jgi:uncharacterized protein (TIGR00369 family)